MRASPITQTGLYVTMCAHVWEDRNNFSTAWKQSSLTITRETVRSKHCAIWTKTRFCAAYNGTHVRASSITQTGLYVTMRVHMWQDRNNFRTAWKQSSLTITCETTRSQHCAIWTKAHFCAVYNGTDVRASSITQTALYITMRVLM